VRDMSDTVEGFGYFLSSRYIPTAYIR
jgi:hypothetical protein